MLMKLYIYSLWISKNEYEKQIPFCATSMRSAKKRRKKKRCSAWEFQIICNVSGIRVDTFDSITEQMNMKAIFPESTRTSISCPNNWKISFNRKSTGEREAIDTNCKKWPRQSDDIPTVQCVQIKCFFFV